MEPHLQRRPRVRRWPLDHRVERCSARRRRWRGCRQVSCWCGRLRSAEGSACRRPSRGPVLALPPGRRSLLPRPCCPCSQRSSSGRSGTARCSRSVNRLRRPWCWVIRPLQYTTYTMVFRYTFQNVVKIGGESNIASGWVNRTPNLTFTLNSVKGSKKNRFRFCLV